MTEVTRVESSIVTARLNWLVQKGYSVCLSQEGHMLWLVLSRPGRERQTFTGLQAGELVALAYQHARGTAE